MKMRITLMLKSAFLALFLLLAGNAAAQQAFERQELLIQTKGGRTHTFEVELALTAEQRAQGLMHRESMPANQGMLFDFGESRPVAMWMKNTPLSLDMLFIQRDGVISHIHQRAVPFSESIIDSRGPVAYVLELNGGRTDALDINIGDRVINKRIDSGK